MAYSGFTYQWLRKDDEKYSFCDAPCPVTKSPILYGDAFAVTYVEPNLYDKDTHIYTNCFNGSLLKNEWKDLVEVEHPMFQRTGKMIDLNKIRGLRDQYTRTKYDTAYGGAPPKRTARKVRVAGRDRCLYLGKHSKQYVKMGGRFVAVASLK